MDIISVAISAVVYLCLGIFIVVPVILIVVGVIGGIGVGSIPLLRTSFTSARLRRSGISAPALVNSVEVGLATSFGFHGKHSRQDLRWRVYFDVIVQPANGSPFQAKFMALLRDNEVEGISNEKKIWVRYDPNDHTKVAFEETGSTRTSQDKNLNLVSSFSNYAQLNATRYVPLYTSGARCPAVILQREKLVDPPPGNLVLYRFSLEVTPESGPSYKTESQLMIQDEKRFSVGNKVFVRFDPKDPTFVAIENF